jgi:hypothetical protein
MKDKIEKKYQKSIKKQKTNQIKKNQIEYKNQIKKNILGQNQKKNLNFKKY